MNVVIRKELRLYASNLRKAVATHVASSSPEPDMGLAHKRVGTSSTPYKMLRVVLHMIGLSIAIMLAHVRQHIPGPDTAGNLKSTIILFCQVWQILAMDSLPHHSYRLAVLCNNVLCGPTNISIVRWASKW